MAQFITLTPRSDQKLRVNIDQIVSYHPAAMSDEPETLGSMIRFTHDAPAFVRETAEEVDRLINPTGTR